ncbi:hypothetical protein QJQ45_005485 [Haematococcus lacustris]|nr:hypothetical protein QJQ45_005485 [Haematococcus lacustris]
MAAAQSRQAAYANKARRDVEYKVGQKVLLSTKNLKLQPGKARKLITRYVGPFEILLLVGAVAVKLDLPASMSRLHPVFHVSLIKPYTGTDVGFMPPPVTWMDETPVYYVERLLDHKGVKDNKASFYLVQWEGYDSTHNTWEPRSNMTDCDKVLAEYNAIHHLKLRPARRGPTVAPTPKAVAAREAADAARLVSPRDAAIARLPANIDPASPAATELINFLEEQAWPEAHTEYPVYLHGRSVTEHKAMLEASLQRMVARNAAADAPLVEEGQLEDDDEEEELDERDTAIQELHASLQAREDVLVAVQARLTALEASQAAVNAGAHDKLMNFELLRMSSGVTLQAYITEFRNTITMCGAGCMNRALTVATFQRGLTPQLRGAVAKDLRSLPHPTLEDAVSAAIDNHKANVASAGANVTPSKRGAGHVAVAAM